MKLDGTDVANTSSKSELTCAYIHAHIHTVIYIKEILLHNVDNNQYVLHWCWSLQGTPKLTRPFIIDVCRRRNMAKRRRSIRLLGSLHRQPGCCSSNNNSVQMPVIFCEQNNLQVKRVMHQKLKEVLVNQVKTAATHQDSITN